MAIESVVTKDLGIVNFLDCCGGPDSNPPVSVKADAILKPRIVYARGFDNGAFQSLYDLVPPNGDGIHTTAGWNWIESGGKNGKGYILTNDINEAGSDGKKAFWLIRVPNNAVFGDTVPYARKGGMHVRFNLFGQTLVNPLTVIAAVDTYSLLTGAPSIHSAIRILTDYSIDAGVGNSPFTTLDASGTVLVPSASWFALEPQWCISRRGNDTSGFIICKLFTEDNITTGGQYIISTIGSKTRNNSGNDFFSYYAFGSQCDTSLNGLRIGIDDVIIYNADGTRKRFINDAIVGSAWAKGDASIQSVIQFDSNFTQTSEDPHALSGLQIYGLADRYKNVNRTDITRSDTIQIIHNFGDVSPFTGVWLTGPFDYPPGSDLVQRNTFEDTAKDFYTVDVNDDNIVQVEGVQPFFAQGRRSVEGDITSSEFNSLVSLHGNGAAINAGGIFGKAAGDYNTTSRQYIRSNGVIASGRLNFNTQTWKAYSGIPYTINPYSFFDIDPNGNIAWTLSSVTNLKALQVGIGGDFTLLDAYNVLNPGNYVRWIEFDIAQAGFEYVYHTVVFTEDELSPFPPRAGFGIVGLNIPTRFITVFPAHIDWDGTVVSAVLDWGDGSGTVNLLGDDSDSGGITASHTYATTGTKHIKLTVTDNDGLVTVYVYDLVLPNNDPVANFSVADAGGNLADLTDTSTDNGGTIVAWLWKVDGVTIATTQNVVGHDFGAPGTYTVSLTVTDNDGATNEAHTDVTIPLGGAGGCGLSAAALANTAWVQGDDYNGGNPPLPAYVNTAAFDNYYEGSTFRETYESANASAGVDHRISTVVQFNGRNTLEMDFGAGHPGAGWYGGLTDDGSPVETNAPFFGGYRTLWSRMIFAADAGVMSDAGAVGFGQGLTIYEMDLQLAFGSAIIMNRANNLYLDVNEGAGHGGNQAPILIAADGFVGSGTFKELITLLERENEGDGTFRVRVWYGNACSLSGVSPLVNQLFSPTTLAATNGVVSPVVFFNTTFTPSGAIKHLWVSLHERVPRLNTENGIDNPYGVALT